MERRRISVGGRAYAEASALAFIQGRARSRVVEEALATTVAHLGKDDRRRLEAALAVCAGTDGGDDAS